MSHTPHGGVGSGGCQFLLCPQLAFSSLLSKGPSCSQSSKQFLLLPPSGHKNEHIQVMSVTH